MHQRCSSILLRGVNGESSARNLRRARASYHRLKFSLFPRLTRLVLVAIGCVAAAMTPAKAVFSAGFTPDEVQATGIAQLSDAERARLDELIARDAEFALEGGVVGFSRTFSARLGPSDFQAAGLTHLTAAQLTALDDLAAFRIAHPVAEEPHFVAKSPPPTSGLAAGQIAKGATLSPAAVTSTGWHPEVHGDVHLEAGGGKGGSFYGGGIDLVMADPDGKFVLALSSSQYRGKGNWGQGLWTLDPALAGLPFGWSPLQWIATGGPDGPYGPYSLYGPDDPDRLRNASLRSALDPARLAPDQLYQDAH